MCIRAPEMRCSSSSCRSQRQLRCRSGVAPQKPTSIEHALRPGDTFHRYCYQSPSPRTCSHAHTSATTHAMAYFRITLLRSAIGLPRKTTGVLKALGLRKRMNTVYHPVSPSIAGQIFAVKELIDVQEVEQALTPTEMKELRRPDPGYYVERKARDVQQGDA